MLWHCRGVATRGGQARATGQARHARRDLGEERQRPGHAHGTVLGARPGGLGPQQSTHAHDRKIMPRQNCPVAKKNKNKNKIDPQQ